ncbi:DUF6252 family protein [Flavobacteriaceae bacterium 14752]|uniref:DUF6252 family protein n=1 Tax=Mesohalobacter salilacus TaxID=2491711 RepID=UPI000F641B73|nr:hypothetical protein EIG84_02845 [Flavobacteriaceae bacterium 14752]
MHHFRFLTILFSLLLISCSNDDSTTELTLEPEFSVEINDNAFDAEFKEAFLSDGVLYIQASDSDGSNKFVLKVNNPAETTYTTGNTDINLIPQMSFQPSSDQLSRMANPTEVNAGSISIAEFDTTNDLVSGSFSFEGSSPFFLNTHEFTSGVFTDIPISESEPENIGRGTLSFEIDDEDFTPSNLFINRLVLPEVGNDGIDLIIEKPNYPTFILQFPTNTPTGEFTLVPLTNYTIQANLDTTTFIGSSNNATLTIIENDTENNHIVGSFDAVLDNEFTAGNNSTEFTITNGQFDIYYSDF